MGGGAIAPLAPMVATALQSRDERDTRSDLFIYTCCVHTQQLPNAKHAVLNCKGNEYCVFLVYEYKI